jgi:hypothetical protein
MSKQPDVPRTVTRSEETDAQPCAVCNHTEKEFKDLRAERDQLRAEVELLRLRIKQLEHPVVQSTSAQAQTMCETTGCLYVQLCEQRDAAINQCNRAGAERDQLQARVDELVDMCGQVYQVIGVLAHRSGTFGTDEVERVLDNLSEARKVHADLLPFNPWSTSNDKLRQGENEDTVLAEGWAVIHPNGYVETRFFYSKLDRYRDTDGYLHHGTPEQWMKCWFPESKLVRVNLVQKSNSRTQAPVPDRVCQVIDGIVADATLLPDGCPEPWRRWIVEAVKLLSTALGEGQKEG